jgi:hypothetical protein
MAICIVPKKKTPAKPTAASKKAAKKTSKPVC